MEPLKKQPLVVAAKSASFFVLQFSKTISRLSQAGAPVAFRERESNAAESKAAQVVGEPEPPPPIAEFLVVDGDAARTRPRRQSPN